MKGGKNMRNKIVGIVVFMLVATMVVSAININSKESNNIIVNTEPYEPSLFDWSNVDQKQTYQDGRGNFLVLNYTYGQEFTPTKDTLTAVSIYLFKYGTPSDPIHITVSIRDNITGSDLAAKTIDTSSVTISKTKWVLFDFEDIATTPEKIYTLCVRVMVVILLIPIAGFSLIMIHILEVYHGSNILVIGYQMRQRISVLRPTLENH